MANNTARAAKLADRIKVVVAETLKTRIKDPRLGFVTITDARITGDLREATVFYTVYGDETERVDVRRGAGARQGRPAQRGRPADRAEVHPDPGLRGRRDAGGRQADRRAAGPRRRSRTPRCTRSPRTRSTPAKPTRTARRVPTRTKKTTTTAQWTSEPRRLTENGA